MEQNEKPMITKIIDSRPFIIIVLSLILIFTFGFIETSFGFVWLFLFVSLLYVITNSSVNKIKATESNGELPDPYVLLNKQIRHFKNKTYFSATGVFFSLLLMIGSIFTGYGIILFLPMSVGFFLIPFSVSFIDSLFKYIRFKNISINAVFSEKDEKFILNPNADVVEFILHLLLAVILSAGIVYLFYKVMFSLD